MDDPYLCDTYDNDGQILKLKSRLKLQEKQKHWTL